MRSRHSNLHNPILGMKLQRELILGQREFKVPPKVFGCVTDNLWASWTREVHLFWYASHQKSHLHFLESC